MIDDLKRAFVWAIEDEVIRRCLGLRDDVPVGLRRRGRRFDVVPLWDNDDDIWPVRWLSLVGERLEAVGYPNGDAAAPAHLFEPFRSDVRARAGAEWRRYRTSAWTARKKLRISGSKPKDIRPVSLPLANEARLNDLLDEVVQRVGLVNPDDKRDAVAEAVDRMCLVNEVFAASKVNFDAGLAEWLRDHGPLAIGDNEWVYEAVRRTHCRDVVRLLEHLTTVVTTLPVLASHLANQPARHQACRVTLGERIYNQLFVEVVEGRPVVRRRRSR